MAAFDFPNSPSNGQTYSANGIDWIYNGNVWKKDATAGVKGQKGEVGQKGQKGEVGEKGDKGQKGEDNSTKGQKGEIGATGGTGGTGSQGDKGQKGEVGAAATKGQKGEIGAQGGTGGTGNDGADGDKGQKGEIGVTGTVFTSGTRMLFQQSTAPTGWTKDTSRNDRALRIVSGNVGDGGGDSFSSRLNTTVNTGNGSVHGHILSQNEIPSHYHYAFRSGNAGQLRNGSNMSANNYPGSGTGPGNLYETYNITARNEIPDVGRTSTIGGDGSHGHGFTNPNFNLNVLYTDVIIAQKN